MGVKRTRAATTTALIPEPLPTPEDIADLIQSYRDSGWGWETLEKVSGVNHATLRKMLAQEGEVWYSKVAMFWEFHRGQLATSVA